MEAAIEWAVIRKLPYIVITKDDVCFYPKSGTPSDKDLGAPVKPGDKPGNRVKAFNLVPLNEYVETGKMPERAPTKEPPKPDPVPKEPIVVPAFRITGTPGSSVTITVNNAPLPKYTIPWTRKDLAVKWRRIPGVDDLDGAIRWVVHRRLLYICVAQDGYFYPETGSDPSPNDLATKPKSGEITVEVISLSNLIAYADLRKVTYKKSYPSIVLTKNGKPQPVKTYFVKGDKPSGSAWTMNGKIPTSKKYPEMSCLETCSKLYMPWAAIKTQSDFVECWCASTA